MIVISFTGGLVVSLIGHYSKNGEFGYSLFVPKVFVLLAVVYYLFSMVKAIIVSRRTTSGSPVASEKLEKHDTSD